MTNHPQIKFLDILNLVIIFIQLRTEMKVNKQASNDQLLKEIQTDTDAILTRLDRIEKENKNNE